MKTIFVCQKCQFQSHKWIGKCPECESWNSFVEDVVREIKKNKIHALTPTPLTQVQEKIGRITTNIEELDRVLGGGIVEGNLIVLTGEPGIGKSTLCLQIADRVASQSKKILYISGEESIQQISARARRIHCLPENLHMLNHNHLESIFATLDKEKPDFVIIDSIQVMYSDNFPSQAGSITQVRYATGKCMEWCKTYNTPILLIGHVTKDGTLAGPRVFEHLVDTILYLEGDRYHQFRLLRTVKNRYGSTNEIGVFEMGEKGLLEVKNASEAFLSGRKEGSFGSAVTCTLEGSRPFLIEVQALTNTTAFGYPKRTSSGFDVNRMQLLIAVLQKHAKLNLSNQDVYANIIGGIKLRDPGADLALCLAIASSFTKKSLPADLCTLGEVGLSGEIREIPQLAKRIKEAEKLGFKNILTAKTHQKITSKANITQTNDIQETLKIL